jgi:hypothetical protein
VKRVMREPIVPGQYFECVSASENHAVGDVCLVVKIDPDDAENEIEYSIVDRDYWASREEFEASFKFAPDGADRRRKELETLQKELAEAQFSTDKLQRALMSFNPHVDPSTDDVTVDDTSIIPKQHNNPEKAQTALKEARASIMRFTKDMTAKQKRIEALMHEQTKALAAQMEKLKELSEIAEEALHTIRVYLGNDEQVVQIAKGMPAAPEEKIVIRQKVLYMDEESALDADAGGIDFQKVKEFDAWILRPGNIDRILPETKGVIVLKPRYSDIKYTDNWLTNAVLNAENKKTYWLIRNGANLYRIHSSLEVGEHIVPLEDEYMAMFVNREGGQVRPGDAEYMKTMKSADARQRHYMRILLMLQGLIDRVVPVVGRKNPVRIFHPLPHGVDRINIMAERNHEQYVHYIYDAETKRMLPVQHVSFKDWMKEVNGQLQVGHRVVGFYRRAIQDEDREDRLRPSSADLPQDLQIYTLEATERSRRGEELFAIRYQQTRARWISSGGWGSRSEHRVPKNRATLLIAKDDPFVINFDAATIERMEYYLNSRVDRREYLLMFPVLKRAIELKRAEEKTEAPFIELLTGKLVSEYGITTEHAKLEVAELVKWWKYKNREHRALTKDDAKAYRMIMGEAGHRLEKDKVRGTLPHAKAVIAIQFYERKRAMYIGHVKDREYVALTPMQDDDDVFVRETRYRLAASNDGVLPGESKAWTVVDNRRLRWLELYTGERWTAFRKDVRREQFLSGEERQQIVDFIHANLEKRADSRRSDWNYSRWDDAGKTRDKARACYRPLCIWIDEKQSVYVSLQDQKTHTEGKPLTGKRYHPDRSLVDVCWTRKAGELQLSLGEYRRISGYYPLWENRADQYRHGGGPQRTVLWKSEENIKLLEQDVAEYQRIDREARELSRVVNDYRDQVDGPLKAKCVADAKAEFLKEYPDEELWEDHFEKKRSEIMRDAPHTYTLYDALQLLVERDIEVGGKTVQQVLDEAKHHGDLTQRDNNGNKFKDDSLAVLPYDYTFVHVARPSLKEKDANDPFL